MRISPAPGLQLTLVIGLMLALAEPAMAGNKFEIIGGGVSGSSSLKRSQAAMLLFGVGGVFLLSALLATVIPHRNPLFLNYANWRQSAILFLIIGLLAVAGGALLS
jgi:hypothetical protein